MKNLIHGQKTFIRVTVAVFLLLVLFGLSHCAHEKAWRSQVEWEELDRETLPGKEEYPDASALVLLDEGRMELSDGSDIQFSTFEKHRIVKILDRSGQRYANIVIPYSPPSEVDFIQARTISPDGEITVLEEGDIYDVTAFPDFIFYSDQRAKRFTMPAVEEGSIIEYRYRVTIWNLTYWHSWRFQETVPVLLSRFTLSSPAQLDVDYRTYGLDVEPRIIDAPTGFNSTYRWEVRDVAPLQAEVGMPSLNEVTKRLALAPIGVKTWDDVSKWYHQLVQPRMQTDNKIKEITAELAKGAETDYEKLRNIYEWVRDQVRYIAVEIGIGGYQPHPVKKVFATQYGDCKDMVTLLCSMGEEAGIEMYQTLISSKPNGIPDTTLPSQFQFNHVIAYAPEVGENGIWMDPTEKGTEFGELPWYDQGMPVLMVGENGEGQFLTTPKAPVQENKVIVDWLVDLEESGAAIVHGTKKLWGAPASELREELFAATQTSRQKWLERQVASLCSGADLDSFRITGLEPIQNPLQLEYFFQTKTFAVPRSNRMVFRPGPVASFEYPDVFRSAHREYPVRLQFGMQKNVNIVINLPSEWKPETPSYQDSVSSVFGEAVWEWDTVRNQFQTRAQYVIQDEEIPPEKYEAFREFLDHVRYNDLKEVLLIKEDRPVADAQQ